MRSRKQESLVERSDTVESILRDCIRRHDISIAELARSTKVSYEHMYAVVTERESLSIPMALKISSRLRIDPMELLVLQLQKKVERAKKYSLGTIRG
jgi:plasmid maintenance system antidote protein VapI